MNNVQSVSKLSVSCPVGPRFAWPGKCVVSVKRGGLVIVRHPDGRTLESSLDEHGGCGKAVLAACLKLAGLTLDEYIRKPELIQEVIRPAGLQGAQ